MEQTDSVRGGASPSADVRTDALTGRTSLVVPRWDTAKAADPVPLALEMPSGTTPCPFCPDRMAGPHISAGEETGRVARRRARGDWSAIALRNRWPHTIDADAAEVVVLSMEHDAHLGNLPLDDAADAVELMIERAVAQRLQGRHPMVFVNHGTNAGSSQPHPHGQVIGLPVADPLALAEIDALAPASCVLCARVPAERFVARLAGSSIATPEAPAIDYDQLVVQSGHRQPDPRGLAEGIGTALRGLFDVLGPVAYNLLFHLDDHPHVHVTPRTSRHSGYTLSGIATCYIAPSTTNERLARAVAERSAIRDGSPSGVDILAS